MRLTTMIMYDRFIYKIIRPRLIGGRVLELGPGRIWPALSLAAGNINLDVVGVGYSETERQAALDQAGQWQCSQRAEYYALPIEAKALPEGSMDAVVSFGALHAWQQPIAVFKEIARVLKVEGEFFIGDVRQDAAWWSTFWPGTGRDGLREVYRAKKQSLTLADFRALVANCPLEKAVIQVQGPDMWVHKR